MKGFLADTAPILPGRDLTLYDAAVVSRSWEQKRLRQLHDLAVGKTGLQIMTWESLSLRTMPKAALLAAAFSLEVGREYAVEDLISRLTAAGYNRCGMVEGPGQFAVRGGILDIFSPAEDRPVRAEFFGDELDTMGFFDPATQRRSENITSVTVLPVAETQPGLHPGGVVLSTVSALGAQNIGAGKQKRAEQTMWCAALIAVVFGLIVAITIQFISVPVVGLFTTDAEVARLGGQYIRGYIWDCIFAGVHFTFSGYFCACGRSEFSFLHNIIAILLVRIPGVHLTSIWFPDTLFPMGIATACGSLTSIIICLLVFRYVKKKPIRTAV